MYVRVCQCNTYSTCLPPCNTDVLVIMRSSLFHGHIQESLAGRMLSEFSLLVEKRLANEWISRMVVLVLVWQITHDLPFCRAFPHQTFPLYNI